MALRMCRLMVSRMHLAKTDGGVWLFPASGGAATLVGVIHLTQPSLTGLPTAVAMLFPCGTGRVLEIAGAAGEAVRYFDVGPSPTVERSPMYLARDESVAAALLAHAQRIAGAPFN
jgi:hypothetical protein